MADEKRVVDPKDAVKHGYWGYVPDETPNEEYTVAVQGPRAEEAAQGGASATGAGEVKQAETAERQAVKPRAARDTK